jgi:hypothetical protein
MPKASSFGSLTRTPFGPLREDLDHSVALATSGLPPVRVWLAFGPALRCARPNGSGDIAFSRPAALVSAGCFHAPNGVTSSFALNLRKRTLLGVDRADPMIRFSYSIERLLARSLATSSDRRNRLQFLCGGGSTVYEAQSHTGHRRSALVQPILEKEIMIARYLVVAGLITTLCFTPRTARGG